MKNSNARHTLSKKDGQWIRGAYSFQVEGPGQVAVWSLYGETTELMATEEARGLYRSLIADGYTGDTGPGNQYFVSAGSQTIDADHRMAEAIRIADIRVASIESFRYDTVDAERDRKQEADFRRKFLGALVEQYAATGAPIKAYSGKWSK